MVGSRALRSLLTPSSPLPLALLRVAVCLIILVSPEGSAPRFLHKLLDGGLDWASSRNLQHQLWLKWFQAGGVLPWPRVDLWPGTLRAGDIAVLVTFVWLACSRRAVAATLGLSFHGLTQHFLYIPFPSLWACYVVLLEGPRARAVRDEREARSIVTPSTVTPSIVTPSTVTPWPEAYGNPPLSRELIHSVKR